MHRDTAISRAMNTLR